MLHCASLPLRQAPALSAAPIEVSDAMRTAALEFQRVSLSWRLARLSAHAWVREVDRLAEYESVTLEEAMTLLGRRFAGEYLESRRHIVWPMLEYVFMRLEPAYWADPLRNHPRRRPSAAA